MLKTEAVWLSLFTNRFRAIARDMGEVLRRAAVSTNVKERLDYSCALLDSAGRLVVNAPHIPVHLGALGVCVREVVNVLTPRPGDVFVTNHPAFGGSHLPDVTVITPVFAGESLIGFTASRAHHAEIGGITPGSMPPHARFLREEGVIIPPTRLFDAGEPRWKVVERLLSEGPHPSRSPAENIADLHAAVAANQNGGNALLALVFQHGEAEVRRAMEALFALASNQMRAALARLSPATFHACELMDDGSPLCVAITAGTEVSELDFTGTGAVHPGNLNATPAIVRSAVMYVLRLLVGEDLPLNEGILETVRITTPAGSMLNPSFEGNDAPAVVGGNVETSQRLVDTMIKALGLAACSQGTMNNIIFGNERFGYYETACGGSGAGPSWEGTSAVHTHMTNTRITDVEILEHRYPVRVDRFEIRNGSGGAGAHRGGDGVVRELTFLAPVRLSLLTQHRVVAPFGLAGGENGALGSQRLVRASGEVVVLGSIDGIDAEPGDKLIIETPGGGGYGFKDTP